MTFDAEKARKEFALWIIRWARRVRKSRTNYDRRDQAACFNKYELVGGPRDGEVVRCHAIGVTADYAYDGHYRLKSDGRLHFRAEARVSSWRDE